MPRRLTQLALKLLDRAAILAGRTEDLPEHQRTGRRGEEDAYFHLRKLGYIIVARNFRSPRRRGEIDLIGWDGDQLCFIEVKARTSHAVKPAEAAVDSGKLKRVSCNGRRIPAPVKNLRADSLRHPQHPLRRCFSAQLRIVQEHASDVVE